MTGSRQGRVTPRIGHFAAFRETLNGFPGSLAKLLPLLPPPEALCLERSQPFSHHEQTMQKPLLNLPLLRLAALSWLAITSFASKAQAVPTAARDWNEQTLAAIRINLPNPPAHARNLNHVAVAMYDAWAAYDLTAVGYIYNEKVSPLPSPAAAIETARHEAISYAAYRVLWTRFVLPPNPALPVSSTNPAPAGSAATLASINAKLNSMGYSISVAQSASPASRLRLRQANASARPS